MCSKNPNQFDVVAVANIRIPDAPANSAEQIAEVAAAQGLFGIVAPIIVDEHSVIVAGRLQFLAALMRGKPSVSVLRVRSVEIDRLAKGR